ncbi:MAG TPA: ATP-binding cassette domain-containing protein [Tepidisphaeraceae bacterium]|jgi:iron complex transport system ATP-binding protein|nr:ATP-binding cassette domain-containing protein [Tepidisphaeraceae bacterium]
MFSAFAGNWIPTRQCIVYPAPINNTMNTKGKNLKTGEPAIQLNNVGVVRSNRWILHDINWQVPAGACAAVLGPNGAGKSTLTKVIAGHLWPTAGDVRVLGEHFGEVDLHQLRRGLRLVSSTAPVELDHDLTTHEVAMTGFFGTLGLYDEVTQPMRDDAAAMLDRVGLHHVSDHRYATLSSGERMRCLLARALVVRPRLLMLDEPTMGLDFLAREQVLAAVQSLSTALDEDRPTVLMITHHLEELPPAISQVLLLSDGRSAAQGPPAEVLRSEILSPVYQCPMEVTQVGGRYYAHVHPGSWEGILKRR